MLVAHEEVQARQVTVPVAVAWFADQVVQCRFAATSPSSAHVKTMLLGRTSAGPTPHTSTAVAVVALGDGDALGEGDGDVLAEGDGDALARGDGDALAEGDGDAAAGAATARPDATTARIVNA